MIVISNPIIPIAPAKAIPETSTRNTLTPKSASPKTAIYGIIVIKL